MVGVALSGVVLLNGVSINSVDPLYPAVYGTVTDASAAVESFDSCLGHPTPSGGLYHYHVMAPCSISTTYGSTPKSCSQVTSCNGYELTYGEAAYSKSLQPTAIAKDGHIIWGAYNSNGALWDDCDVDVCNGAVIDGYYGYAATSFHPYFVGCWGPGNYATYS